jgi:hypothetical protein
VPEGLSAGEVAHHLGEHHSPHRLSGRLREELVEILEALMLAIVAVATAWSGYQTARFDGLQANLYGISSRDRVVATQAATLSGQERLYDSTVFSAWLQATGGGDRRLAQVFERRFRPAFRPAFHAWLATNPFHNSQAPPGPQLMRQYHDTQAARAAAFNSRAATLFDQGTGVRETGDKYLRNTVLLATVLFLTALAQRFRIFGVRVAVLAVSAVLLGLALFFLSTYPTA